MSRTPSAEKGDWPLALSEERDRIALLRASHSVSSRSRRQESLPYSGGEP